MLEQLPSARAAPRHARPFVALFLAAVAACALGAWNLWPFSSWELFSRLRPDRQIAWAAVAVEAGGRREAYRIASLPHGNLGFRTIMAGFAARPAGSRDAICATWLREAHGQFGQTVDSVRIYRLRWLLSARGTAQPVQRSLAWTCTATGAHAA